MPEATASKQQWQVARGVRSRSHAAAEKDHRVIQQCAPVDRILLRLE